MSYPLEVTLEIRDKRLSSKDSVTRTPNNSPFKMDYSSPSSSSDSSWCANNDRRSSSANQSPKKLSQATTASFPSDFEFSPSSDDSSHSRRCSAASERSRSTAFTPTYRQMYSSHSVYLDNLSSTDSDDSFYSKYNKKHAHKK